MNKKSMIVAFLAGVAVGAVASWKALKTRYERMAQKEINSVKEKFAKRYPGKKIDADTSEEESSTLYSQYKAEIESYTVPEEENTEEGVEYLPKPRVITPEELGDEEDYDVVSLSLYADGVLADSITGEPIDDIDNTVGRESLHHMGEYEDDCVHVRNDRLKTYYEILLDAREFNCTPVDE